MRKVIDLSFLQCILAIYLVCYPYTHDKRFLKKIVASDQVFSKKHLYITFKCTYRKIISESVHHIHTHKVQTEKRSGWGEFNPWLSIPDNAMNWPARPKNGIADCK